jgi:hypothetical protein
LCVGKKTALLQTLVVRWLVWFENLLFCALTVHLFSFFFSVFILQIVRCADPLHLAVTSIYHHSNRTFPRLTIFYPPNNNTPIHLYACPLQTQGVASLSVSLPVGAVQVVNLMF